MFSSLVTSIGVFSDNMAKAIREANWFEVGEELKRVIFTIFEDDRNLFLVSDEAEAVGKSLISLYDHSIALNFEKIDLELNVTFLSMLCDFVSPKLADEYLTRYLDKFEKDPVCEGICLATRYLAHARMMDFSNDIEISHILSLIASTSTIDLSSYTNLLIEKKKEIKNKKITGTPTLSEEERIKHVASVVKLTSLAQCRIREATMVYCILEGRLASIYSIYSNMITIMKDALIMSKKELSSLVSIQNAIKYLNVSKGKRLVLINEEVQNIIYKQHCLHLSILRKYTDIAVMSCISRRTYVMAKDSQTISARDIENQCDIRKVLVVGLNESSLGLSLRYVSDLSEMTVKTWTDLIYNVREGKLTNVEEIIKTEEYIKIYINIKQMFNLYNEMHTDDSLGTPVIKPNGLAALVRTREAKITDLLLESPLSKKEAFPYDELKQILHIDSDLELEIFCLHCITTGIMAGRLNSINKTLSVTNVTPRELSSNQALLLATRLDEWADKIHEARSSLKAAYKELKTAETDELAY